MTIPRTDIDLTDLRTSVRGRVSLPGDDDFERARRPWNLAVEQQNVRAVVEAADADDVAALVRFAGERGVAVATQPSGHGATGRASGAILLRTGTLDAISIDPAARTARLGAGVRPGRSAARGSRARADGAARKLARGDRDRRCARRRPELVRPATRLDG